jgi:TonB-linked SusC/RagA family outer membrane protein
MKFFYNASAMQRAFDALMLLRARAMQKFRSNTTKTLILGVKIAAVFILVTCLQVSAKTTNAQKLSLSFKNGSLEKLFAEIEKRTNYVFFYDVAILKGTRPVTVEVKDASVDEILETSLKGQMLEYSIHDRTIFVKKGEKALSLAPGGSGKGLPPAVTGVVKSESGTPLAGASVLIKKLKRSGMTNENGEFVIKDIPNGEYVVEISFVGYQTHTMTITVENNEARVVAGLKQSQSSLDETVVKGYYSTTNRLNTGNVTKVKGEDIQKQPVSDPMMALEGRVPGLYIAQASGVPGSNLSVRLRGQNSISSGINPFYVVDGVPFTSSTLSSTFTPGSAISGVSSIATNTSTGGMSPFSILNPSDIESIEVLKDADATAIYGSRGANGVILITTKKGKMGGTHVDGNVYSGVGEIARKIKLLNTQQYLALRHEAFYNDSMANPTANIKPKANDYDVNGTWDSTRYTDWEKIMIGNKAYFTNAQLSISGGSATTQFLIGGGYSRQTTVFPGNFADQKVSVHFNLNHTSQDNRFHSVLSVQYANDNNLLPNSDFTGKITLAPDAPFLYDPRGNLNWQNGTWANPFASLLSNTRNLTENLMGDLNLSYEILPNLQLKSSFGYTHMQMNQSQQIPATAYYGLPIATNRYNFSATSNINTWIIEPQINYTKKVKQGKFDAFVGTTFQENKQNSIGQYGYGFTSDALITNIAAASSITISGSNYTDYRYAALFSRINYNWQDKYLINLTARRDGSSRFGPAKQFGNFGAIGAAWIFSKERLIQNTLPFLLSFGKLRVSYGSTGNDQIADYQYLSTYSSYTTSSYQTVNGLYPTRIANPYFGWELVKKLEGGIDLGFWHDRILLNVSYYRNRTENQLVGQTIPSIDGFTTIQENLPAVVQNTGVEFGLNTINIKSKDFNWSTSINLSIPRNKLFSYPGLETSSNKTIYAIGQPLSVQSLYHFTGVNPATGLYTFQDFNKNGKLDAGDLQFLAPITQSYFGGFQNSFSFKNWQADIFFQFVKQTGRNYLTAFGQPGFNANQPAYVLDRWHQAGDITKIERSSQTTGDAKTAQSYALASDYRVGDASFVRLKNVALSYSLPSEWQRKMHLQKARIYIQCQNLITITSYKGLDPETQGLVLPPLRMLTAGIGVGL